MRKYYIDNLRSIVILLLFPVHTFMIWNDFGSVFYIWVSNNRILSTAIVLINPWFMPLLFVLAGMSARYSLEKRTVKEFIVQRFCKLALPFMIGTVLLVPFQTLYARKYFYDYQGGIFDNLKYFFTHFTDLSGYDGAFTPGQLWFILFLFVISVFSLIIFKLIPYDRAAAYIQKTPVQILPLLFIPVWLMYYLGNFGGFSLGKSLALYLAGYYFLSDDAVIEKLEKNIKWLGSMCVICIAASAALYYCFSYYGDMWVNFTGWLSILVLLILGKRFLNNKTKVSDYFKNASYLIYILHQSVLVALAYYIVRICDITAVSAAVICIGSFILTVLIYELIRRCRCLILYAGTWKKKE